MSFDTRDLTVHLMPGIEGQPLLACNVCNSTPGGAPKPACPPPSKCQASAKPPKGREPEVHALHLAALRGQMRETLRHQV
ncbi:MAG TPA: hypothetical protein DD490_08235 [Acidobacteria bacterium]|nr:hypothetical protein [Acidobacteriota bacterium]